MRVKIIIEEDTSLDEIIVYTLKKKKRKPKRARADTQNVPWNSMSGSNLTDAVTYYDTTPTSDNYYSAKA